MLKNYDLSRFRRVADVGGNEGFFLKYLLAGAPDATGVVFDRPEVMDGARETMAAAGLADRVEFVGGDFLEEVPAGGDLYVLKGILHDSSNASAHRVLTNCHDAAGPGTALIVLEGILSSDPPFDPIVQLIDINMLMMVNGRERSTSSPRSSTAAAGSCCAPSSCPPPATGSSISWKPVTLGQNACHPLAGHGQAAPAHGAVWRDGLPYGSIPTYECGGS